MIGILGALDAEIASFLAQLGHATTEAEGPFLFHTGRLSGHEVVIAKSGVGKVMSTLTTQKMLDSYRPSHVLFTGIAGALNPTLDIGDLVISRDCVQHDVDAQALGFRRGEIPYTGVRAVAADPELVARAAAFSPSSQKSFIGRILSGDQFITHAGNSSHRFLREELAGDAVEMEGAAVAFTCSLQSIPFVVLRTISDRANHDAAVDFEKFLPVASQQSCQVVCKILSDLAC